LCRRYCYYMKNCFVEITNLSWTKRFEKEKKHIF